MGQLSEKFRKQIEAMELDFRERESSLSDYLRKKNLGMIEEAKKKYEELCEFERDAVEKDPFWFYTPVSGELSGERREFLKKHLREEDIPQRMDGAVDVHLSTAPIRGASGGNQSSKTTLGCIEAYITATGALPFCFNPNSPMKRFDYPAERLRPSRNPKFVRVIGEDYQNGVLKNLIPTYRHWAPKEYLLGHSWDRSFSAGELTVRLYKPGTSELVGGIEFMSNKQELGTFQGPARHKLILDEEPEKEVYKENLLRFTTADYLDVLFTMTPTKGLSWTYDLMMKGQDESGHKVEWFKIASVCNPYANLKVLEEILDEMESYDEIRMRLLGEFISLSGLVYGRLFDHRIHVIEPFETGCTCGGIKYHDPGCGYLEYLCYMGIDPHMVKDSCAVLAALDREKNIIVDTCYKRSVDTDRFKADLSYMTFKKRMDWAVFDPSSDSNITVFRGRNIFWDMTHGENRIRKAFKADKFQGSIVSGVDNIKRRLRINPLTSRPSLFIMNRPENQELIKSFRTLQRDSFVNEDVKGQRDKIAEGIHDHHACLRYILQNNMLWKPWIEVSQESPISDREALVG